MEAIEAILDFVARLLGRRHGPPRLFAYDTAPERLILDPPEPYGRLLVARDPNGVPLAVCWDAPETRSHALRWANYGLSIEVLSREMFRVLCAQHARHVFAASVPVGELLSPDAAARALAVQQ